jgi:hypothetical protein
VDFKTVFVGVTAGSWCVDHIVIKHELKSHILSLVFRIKLNTIPSTSRHISIKRGTCMKTLVTICSILFNKRLIRSYSNRSELCSNFWNNVSISGVISRRTLLPDIACELPKSGRNGCDAVFEVNLNPDFVGLWGEELTDVFASDVVIAGLI